VPIEIQCGKCNRKFRVPDKFAGKRVKCAGCEAAIAVPGAQQAAAKHTSAKPRTAAESGPKKAVRQREPAKPQTLAAKKATIESGRKRVVPQKRTAESRTPVPQKSEWHLQTEDGEQFGPVTRKEMDQWVADGRIDASCQLLRDGWDQWKWAEDVYPDLAQSPSQPEEENPFAGIGDRPAPVEVDVNPFESRRGFPGDTSVPAITTEDMAASQAGISTGITRALADTRPWVLFLSVVGFVIGGLGALLSVFLLLTSLVAIANVGAPGAVMAFVGLFYMLATFLYLYVSYLLFNYASTISRFLRSKEVRDLERAMVAQKSFWKVMGIVTAVWLALSLGLVFISIAMGGFAAMVG